MKIKLLCFFITFATVFSSLAANQIVSNNNDSGAGSLRQAIVDAGDGDEITFNLSSGNETIVLSSTLNLAESLTIDGSNTSGSGVAITIQVTTPGTSSYRVFRIDASGKTIIISNMTIKGGNLGTYPGGGVYAIAGTVNFNYVVISDSKGGNGGGLALYGANCSINNSTIKDNSSTARGAGIALSSGSTLTRLANSTISNNSSNSFGGGIYVSNGTISELTSSTITGNSASYGGGINIFQESGLSNLHLSNSTIYGNTASNTGNDLYMSSGTFTVKNSIIGDYHNSGGYGNFTDNGYNVVETSNIAANASTGFNNSTTILYNTKHNTSGTSYTSWGQGGTMLINQNLNLSSTLTNNGGTTLTLALTAGSFAGASVNSGIPPASNWNGSPLIDGVYTDQRGVLRTTGQYTSIGAYSENYSSSQASEVSFSNSSNIGTSISWVRAPNNYCAVFIAATTSGAASPVDNTTYAANTSFGTGSQIGVSGWYCVYNGTGTIVSVTNLTPNDNYTVHVCEYDGTAGTEEYDSSQGVNNPGSYTTFYNSGMGTSDDPFKISNTDNLIYLSNTTSDWNKYFIQTNDIVFNSDETLEDWDGNGSADGYPGTSGFSPIGNSTTKFTGGYNGGGFSIDNLYINNSDDNTGFIGYLENGSIDSLGITNVSIQSTGGNTGALVSRSANSNITFCYSTGSIGSSGIYKGGIGGLLNSSSFSQCFSSCSVSADTRSGGFIGKMDSNSSLSNCYSAGAVTVGDFGGGFLGISYTSSSTNCYSTGLLSGSGSNRGGFAGYDDAGASYTNCFWDTQTTGTSTSTGGTGKTTAEMKVHSTFTDIATSGLSTAWDFINNPNNDAANNDYWDMDQVQSVNNGYPILNYQEGSDVVLEVNQWTGGVSTDWNNSSNWNKNISPSANYDVSIPNGLSNYPVITTSGTCHNLTVNNGATLTINSGGTFITNGPITNDGTISAERTLTGSAQAWHMISGPAIADISDNGWNPDNNDDFFTWDEADPGTWVNYKVSSGDLNFPTENGGDNFVAGKGYLVAYNTVNPSKSITGTPNTGEVSISLKNSGGTKSWTYNSGWNLLGNPYPSSIDWNLVDRSRFQDNFVYIYDPNKSGGEGYVTIDGGNSNAYIAPFQAFFVQASAAANNQSFVFTNQTRAHGGTFYKSETESTTINIRLTSENYFDDTRIAVNEASSNIRDRQDALKLYSFNPEVPQLYTFSSDDIPLSTNRLPSLNLDTEVRLGLLLPEPGQYRISCTQIMEQLPGNGLWLIDKKLEAVHDFTKGEYSFNSEETELASRFVLKFLNITDSIEEAKLSAWINGNYLYFSNTEREVYISITDLSGRQILATTLPAKGSYIIPIRESKGIYLVHLKNSTTRLTLKAFIN